MIVWLLTVAARRKLTESLVVVTPIPAGALVSTDDPSARFVTKAAMCRPLIRVRMMRLGPAGHPPMPQARSRRRVC